MQDCKQCNEGTYSKISKHAAVAKNAKMAEVTKNARNVKNAIFPKLQKLKKHIESRKSK